jgi:hypothetical protein
MVKTHLPTKSEYDRAVDELKKLNEDDFYDDFKDKIEKLEKSFIEITVSHSNDFKKEAENISSRASMLFRQMESQQKEIKGYLEEKQNHIIQKNQDFLELERTQLLFVYEELQKSIQLFNERMLELQQTVENRTKDLLGHTLQAIGNVSSEVTEFTKKLSNSDERNIQFLKQNEAYVTLTKEKLALTEGKIASHMAALQDMENQLKQMHKRYEEMFQRHSDSIKTILTVREEALINKITQQIEYSDAKHFEHHENMKRELQQWHEHMEALNKKSNDILGLISSRMSSKEDLENVEKKSKWKLNFLLAIVAIEVIVIGINYFL